LPFAGERIYALTFWAAHAALMAVQAFRGFIPRRELAGLAFFVVIGIALIVLAPAKKSGERA
jgi:hypothetical protein